VVLEYRVWGLCIVVNLSQQLSTFSIGPEIIPKGSGGVVFAPSVRGVHGFALRGSSGSYILIKSYGTTRKEVEKYSQDPMSVDQLRECLA
jgi:hypothetical protein